MTYPKRPAIAVLLLIMLGPATGHALTLAELRGICAAAGGRSCSDVPIVQAYVGGALDLVAMLDEETEYLRPLYCREARTFFDVPSIIRFLESLGDEWLDRNAMLGVIRYLEQEGDCPPWER